MSQFKTYGGDFPPRFAGQEVEVEFKTLPGEAAAFLREQVRKDNHLQAHLGVLGLAIQKLKVDGEWYIRPAGRKQRRDSGAAVALGQNIPQVMDPETEEELWSALLEHIVKNEWWLLKGDYRAIFEEFAPEDENGEIEAPGPNPTASPVAQIRTEAIPGQ